MLSKIFWCEILSLWKCLHSQHSWNLFSETSDCSFISSFVHLWLVVFLFFFMPCLQSRQWEWYSPSSSDLSTREVELREQNKGCAPNVTRTQDGLLTSPIHLATNIPPCLAAEIGFRFIFSYTAIQATLAQSL